MLFAGVPREPGAENLWIMNGLRIFQEPSVMYLSGINQPEIILALVPWEKNPVTLFLPEKNPKKEFWDGASNRAQSLIFFSYLQNKF